MARPQPLTVRNKLLHLAGLGFNVQPSPECDRSAVVTVKPFVNGRVNKDNERVTPCGLMITGSNCAPAFSQVVSWIRDYILFPRLELQQNKRNNRLSQNRLFVTKPENE